MDKGKRITEQWILFYPEKQVTEPVICETGRRFDIVINIYSFNVIPSSVKSIATECFSAVAVVEASGKAVHLLEAKEFLTSVGIKYEARRI